MNLSLTALAAAGGATATLLVALAGYGWWQYGKTEDALQKLAEARGELLLCDTDKATLRRELEQQTAMVTEWRTAADLVAEAAARELREAEARRRALEAAIADTQAQPAGSCETEAGVLKQWLDSLR